MSDSVPSLVDINLLCRADKTDPEQLHRLILTYSRHHDPAWKAAREAMNAISRTVGDPGSANPSLHAADRMRRLAREALALLDGKAVPHE